MKTQTQQTKKHYCFKCESEMTEAQVWYHADQDDYICLDCAKVTKHTDTAYAGMLVGVEDPIKLGNRTSRTLQKVMYVENQKGEWEKTEYTDWFDLHEKGWELVDIQDNNTAVMKRNGYFNTFKAVKEMTQ